MPQYKLYYFNGRGRAELARLVFAAAGVPYEDVRFTKDDWDKKKAEFEFGKLPVLEVDGVQLNQSKVIAAHVANMNGLGADNDLDGARAFALVETVSDSCEGLGAIYMTIQDPTEKAKKLEEFKTTKLEPYIAYFDKFLEKNAKESGYAIGNKLTYADLALFNAWNLLEYCKEIAIVELLAKYKNVKAHYEKIGANEKVKAWIESRPKSDF